MPATSDLSKYFLGGKNDSLATYTDRLLLRLHAYPPYSQKLHQLSRKDDGTLELVFTALPPEAIVALRDIIGSVKTEIKFFSFVENGKPMLGVRVKPPELDVVNKPEDADEAR